MKIEVINPNKIIDSAFIKETKLSFSVMINTQQRYVYPTFISNDLTELTFEFFPEIEFEIKDCDKVIVTAESQEDRITLGRLYWLMDEKDQLWYLFPDQSVYYEGDDK